MGIEIKLDVQAIKAIEDAAVKSAEVAMEQVRADLVSAQTMPFDTGDMQNNQTFDHILHILTYCQELQCNEDDSQNEHP